MSMWKWNYCTLESLSIIKCTLCNATYKPELLCKVLRKHLKVIDDTQHRDALDRITDKSLWWDKHYSIVHTTEIMYPNIQCNYCLQVIPTSNNVVIKIPKKLKKHLQKSHNVGKMNWDILHNWIINKFVEIANNIYCIMLHRNVISIQKCAICGSKAEARNGIMILKHLIIRHSNDIEDIPWKILPKELKSLISDTQMRVRLSREQSFSDLGNIPGTSSGVIPGARPVNSFAARNIALSIDQPSSDPGNIPGTSSGTSAQEYSSSSKRKRDSTTKTDRKRRKLSPIESEDSD